MSKTQPHPSTCSEESVYYSDSFDSSDDENESPRQKSVDRFLMRLPQFDYITEVKIFSVLFKGTFKYFSDAMVMSLADKLVVKDLFDENIFHDNFGMSIVQLTHNDKTFLMQPHVWNVIELEKDLLNVAYNEVIFRLAKKEDKKLVRNDVLFRFGIPLAFDFLFHLDYIYDESEDSFKVKLSYTNKSFDSGYKNYCLILPANSFIDFLGYCPFMGILSTNGCLAENIHNPSEIFSPRKFGKEVNEYLMGGRTPILESIKKEFSVKRVYQ